MRLKEPAGTLLNPWVRLHPRNTASYTKGRRADQKQDQSGQVQSLVRPVSSITPHIEVFVETEEVKKMMEKMTVWLGLGYPVHIVGPTGCGKTTIAFMVANKLGRPVIWMSGDAESTTTSLVGGYAGYTADSLRDHFVHTIYKSKDITTLMWVDNPLTVACKYGYSLIYNDFSRARPEANNILLSVLQEGVLELPNKFGEDRFIRVHPDFRVIFTSNPLDYAGTFKPQNALLDRLVTIYMDYYGLETEVEVVKACSGLPHKESTVLVTLVRCLRDGLLDEEKPGTRTCIMAARALETLGFTNEAVEDVLLSLLASKVKSRSDLSSKQELVKKVLNSLDVSC